MKKFEKVWKGKIKEIFKLFFKITREIICSPFHEKWINLYSWFIIILLIIFRREINIHFLDQS